MQVRNLNFSIKKTILVPLIFILWGAGSSIAQNSVDDERGKDSVFTLIYNLLDAAKYTEAHAVVEHGLYTYRNDGPFTAALYLAFSDVERLTGNMDIAFAHARKAEAIMLNEGTDYWNLKKNTVYQRLANLYFESKQYDSAVVYAQKAIYSARDYNIKQYGNMQVQNLPIIGHHYFLQGKYDKAEGIYLQAIELNLSMDYICENGNIYEKLSEIKAKESKKKPAVYYAEKAYHIGDSCGYIGYKLAAVNRLVGIYEQFHDYEMVAKTLQLKMKLLEETQLHGKSQFSFGPTQQIIHHQICLRQIIP
jgi:tetratricopeptide (TPR) repeat protein